MEKKIAILRGINVGGRRKILMEDLRELFAQQGFESVRTYIQSGNILFETTSEDSNSTLERQLEAAITARFGFDVPVIIRTSKELQAAAQQNPFYSEDADISSLHLTFLNDIPTKENYQKALSKDYAPDAFSLKEKYVFVRCEGKYHKSKLSNAFFEKHFQVNATTRNWKTVLKLVELSK
ncbi:MAG: DUF1697 domain-containing protein [Bacteroidota bacterium]